MAAASISEDEGATWRELERFSPHPDHTVNHIWFNHVLRGKPLDGEPLPHQDRNLRRRDRAGDRKQRGEGEPCLAERTAPRHADVVAVRSRYRDQLAVLKEGGD